MVNGLTNDEINSIDNFIKGTMKTEDYPDIISVTKQKNNKFRYSVRYKNSQEVLRAAKAYPTAAAAWQAAHRAVKAHDEKMVNFIK